MKKLRVKNLIQKNVIFLETDFELIIIYDFIEKMYGKKTLIELVLNQNIIVYIQIEV
jgi:hypothetical protein